MASFLQKFIRGGAEMGGKLFADQAREQMRADIMAKRDQVLNENRLSLEQQRQEFSTAQHQEIMAQKEQHFQREQESPRAKAEGIALSSAENLQSLKEQYASAETDAERADIAKLMAAEQGKPMENVVGSGSGPTAAQKEARVLAQLDEFKDEAEALKFLKSKEGNMTRELFKAMQAKQENDLISPDDPNYLTLEQMLTKAREISKSKPANPDTKTSVSPKDGGNEHFNTTNNPSVSTQEEFDKLESGALYFDVFDGKSYRKP